MLDICNYHCESWANTCDVLVRFYSSIYDVLYVLAQVSNLPQLSAERRTRMRMCWKDLKRRNSRRMRNLNSHFLKRSLRRIFYSWIISKGKATLRHYVGACWLLVCYLYIRRRQIFFIGLGAGHRLIIKSLLKGLMFLIVLHHLDFKANPFLEFRISGVQKGQTRKKSLKTLFRKDLCPRLIIIL